MWNILAVIIIAAAIWMFNPLGHFSPKQHFESQKKTRQEVNQVETEAYRQMNEARQAQQQEKNSMENQ